MLTNNFLVLTYDGIKVCERTGQQGTCESYPHYMKWGMPIELINRTSQQEYYTAIMGIIQCRLDEKWCY